MNVLAGALLLAAILPGFRAELVGTAAGFVTSVVADSRGRIYYTTTDGSIFTLDGRVVARVTTEGVGNSGLLGMALADDHTAVIHYTTPNQTYDVISRIDLDTGEETVLHRFVCDIEVTERGVSTEHHGGNPIIAPDGSVLVGIGDYGSMYVAASDTWNGGKLYRIAPDGSVQRFARGLRNPFDLAWDDAQKRVIVSDNGPLAGDEIHIISEGADCGWPYTYGNNAASLKGSPPDYVFPTTVAPTGMFLLNGANPVVRSGLLLATYVTEAVLYFPRVQPGSVSDPVAIFSGELGPVIDVTQTATGEIYFATGNAIYRLTTPRRGDCDGDGIVGTADLEAVARELTDGPKPMTAVIRGTWGCDATGDGLITAADRDEILRMLNWHRRIVRR